MLKHSLYQNLTRERLYHKRSITTSNTRPALQIQNVDICWKISLGTLAHQAITQVIFVFMNNFGGCSTSPLEATENECLLLLRIQ